ncbi:MAG: hypothetical protein MUC85_04435 [Anaerolineales bacterium]|jgi:cell shape-determining protein MreD|nr:hypothetical protein [Anaerolineales bacterium]
MLGILLSLPVLGGLTMLQVAVISRAPLLHGSADLVLIALIAWTLHERVSSAWIWGLVGGLMVGYVSALPFWTYPAAYLAAVGFARLVRRRVWKSPILAMFAAVFTATLIQHAVSLAGVSFGGTFLPVLQVINQISVPSLLLNMLAAIPVYVLMHDLANWAYPEELVE